MVECTDFWERISNGEDGFMVPQLDSLVGEISFFFLWIKFTKHHKITIHYTFIHEPFLSFSTNENISLHWNMNGDLKLVSWITHLQPFFFSASPLVKPKGSEREVLSFQCPHASLPACEKLLLLPSGNPHVQEGRKHQSGVSKVGSLVFVKLYHTLEKY